MKTNAKLINTWELSGASRKEKNENNDCGVRAIMAATGVSYDVAHKFCADHLGRKEKKGTFINLLTKGEVPAASAKVLKSKFTLMGKEGKRLLYRYKVGAILKTTFRQPKAGVKFTTEYRKAGFGMWVDRKKKAGNQMTQMTVGTFLEEYPKGTYLISIKRHVFTIIDGVVHGNHDDAKRLKARILQAHEVTKIVAKRKARLVAPKKEVAKKRKVAPKVFEKIAAI